MPKLDGIHIQKAQKQHSSVVVVIPILVRRALGIKAGDHIVFTSHSNNHVVEMSKFIPGGKQNGKCNRRSGRKN